MIEQPRVTLIILNWNGLAYTRDCLDSLRRITYGNAEILVIDNGSKNNEAEILENEYQSLIQVIRLTENLGFAEGNNIGIRRAISTNAKYVCLLNNDTVIEPTFLELMVNASEADDRIAMVAPTMRVMNDHSVVDNLGITMTLSGLPFNRKEQNWRLFCPSGGAVLYRCSALCSVVQNNDYFDPEYFAYVEDLDLGWRLLWQGYRAVYAEKALVFHHGSAATSPMSDFAVFQTQKNLLLTWIKNLPMTFILKYGWAMFVIQCAHHVLYIFRHQFQLAIKADLAALRLFPRYQRFRRTNLKKGEATLRHIMELIEPKIIPRSYLKALTRTAVKPKL